MLEMLVVAGVLVMIVMIEMNETKRRRAIIFIPCSRETNKTKVDPTSSIVDTSLHYT